VDAAEVSAAGPAYGLPDPAANENSNENSSVASSVLPLLILVIGLAVATVWFVALPAFDPPRAKPSCEVVVLKSGSPACVPEPMPGSQAAPHKSSSRAKH
jgi:hypothetical protein